jgi:hypothetical protein
MEEQLKQIKEQSIVLNASMDKLNDRLGKAFVETKNFLTQGVSKSHDDTLKGIVDYIDKKVAPESQSSLVNLKDREGLGSYQAHLNEALAKAKMEWKRIGKGSSGYNGKYAKLEDVLDQTTPILAKHGLTVVQFVEDNEFGKLGIRTRINHASGEYSQAFMTMPKPVMGGKMSQEQSWGCTISYFKRYNYNSALGIIIGEETDNDGDPELHGGNFKK